VQRRRKNSEQDQALFTVCIQCCCFFVLYSNLCCGCMFSTRCGERESAIRNPVGLSHLTPTISRQQSQVTASNFDICKSSSLYARVAKHITVFFAAPKNWWDSSLCPVLWIRINFFRIRIHKFFLPFLDSKSNILTWQFSADWLSLRSYVFRNL
jgi:hypothetical protein